MSIIKHQSGWVIIASIIIAFALLIVPLPEEFGYARPEFALLVMIYWCIAIPERIGVISAWTVGLFQDALQGTMIGLHALTFAIVAYIAVTFYHRIRVSPLWSQCLTVLVLMLLHQLLFRWIYGFAGRPISDLYYWSASVFSAVMWPVVFSALRAMRRRFEVS